MLSGGKRRIEIQDRDVAILRTLFECRVMTRSQAALLHFDGKTEAAKKRLQLLKAAGYVSDRPRLPHDPAVLVLTRKGFELLEGTGALQMFPAFRNWKQAAKRLSVSPLTIQHELEVMDVRAAIVAAVHNQPKLSIAQISTWPAMIAFEAYNSNGERVEIRPDGLLRVVERSDTVKERDHWFFIEVDRSTESQTKLMERLFCYYNYYDQVKRELRSGRDFEIRDRFPFRVLITCRSDARCNELLEQLFVCGKRTAALIWITPMSEAKSNPLSAIWRTAGMVDQMKTRPLFGA
jgi:hypothetical protein